MQTFSERSGTNVLICAPVRPVSKKLRCAISEVICDIDAIVEAHLPDVIAVGSGAGAAHVLFLVFEQRRQIQTTMEAIDTALASLSSSEETFDIWPITRSHELLGTIREINCVIGWRD